jgi:hypothetical protein
MKKVKSYFNNGNYRFLSDGCSGTIVDIAVGNKIFSTLVAAVKQLI